MVNRFPPISCASVNNASYQVDNSKPKIKALDHCVEYL